MRSIPPFPPFPPPRPTRRGRPHAALAPLACALVLCLWARHAVAADDDDLPAHALEARTSAADADEEARSRPLDDTPRADAAAAPRAGTPRSPLRLGLGLGVRLDELLGSREWLATLSLTLPFDRLGMPLAALPALPPRVAVAAALPSAPPPASPPTTPAATDSAAVRPVVSAAEASHLVAAALHEAGLDREERRIDSLASRARASAGLPELRLRVARVTDEAQAFAPTEYDPLRRTAAAGATLWLEARATWRLDRLLFADEETSLERSRRELAEARERVTTRVLDLIALWQRGATRAADPLLDDLARVQAELDVVRAKTTLHVLTGGAARQGDAPR
jgi:hypothetical protein